MLFSIEILEPRELVFFCLLIFVLISLKQETVWPLVQTTDQFFVLHLVASWLYNF